MNTSRVSWMAVLAVATTLNTGLLVGADNPDNEARPRARRTQGEGANQARERVRDRVQQVAQELNLTEDQKTKLKPIFQNEADKVRTLRADTNLTREQRQEKVKAIREEIRTELKRLLTAEQWEKWQKMRQERPAQRQQQQRQAAKPDTAK